MISFDKPIEKHVLTPGEIYINAQQVTEMVQEEGEVKSYNDVGARNQRSPRFHATTD